MTDRPNVVLVTVDSLRADHCSFMGYERETTPTLDVMAREGVVFENAVAPGPSTPESMPAVFTGHDVADGGGDDLDGGDVDALRASIRRHMETRDTLAEKLSRRGYATGAFTPNPFTSRYFGFDAGFDRFEDFLDTFVRRGFRRIASQLARDSELAFAVRMLLNMWQREEVFKPWEDYYGAALDWAHGATEPYFLWLHLMDPHVPYLASAEYRRLDWWEMTYANYRFWRADKESAFDPELHERLVTAYDDSIRYTDAFFARLRETLDDAVIVVHGDHGEAFGEHGTYGHEPYLYEEQIHVPLVLDGLPARTIADPVSLASLPDLLVDVSERALDGGRPGDVFSVSRTRQGDRTALRGRRVKYIASGSNAELYDLAAGEEAVVSNADLERLCRRSLEATIASDREKREITMAAREIAER